MGCQYGLEVFYMRCDTVGAFLELVRAHQFPAQHNSGLTAMQPVLGHHLTHLVQGVVEGQICSFPVIPHHRRV